MYFHKDSNVIYLAFPRTASKATSSALSTQAGFSRSPNHHGRLWQAESFYPINNDTLVLTTVRNHFDWFVSYAFMVHRIPLTVKVLSDMSSTRLTYIDTEGWLFDYHRLQATHVARFEHLEEDVNKFLSIRGIRPVRIRLQNYSKSRKFRHYSEYYNSETRAFIEDKFGKEMEELGYSF